MSYEGIGALMMGYQPKINYQKYCELRIENLETSFVIQAVRTSIDDNKKFRVERKRLVFKPCWLFKIFGSTYLGRVDKAKEKIQLFIDKYNKSIIVNEQIESIL